MISHENENGVNNNDPQQNDNNGNHDGNGVSTNQKQKRKQRKWPQSIRNGWFSEFESAWPGQKLSLALEEFSEEKSILFYEKSKFQDILVFRSAQHGNVLVLDGVVQFTEDDEFVYHEMITHLPLMSHPNPKNILIVGGGDGGVLREVCRHHQSVTKITLVEIDEMVIDVAQKFFVDSTATYFDDSRVCCIHEDAAEFLRRFNESDDDTKEKFDVIIADSSDPVGPAETLFDPAFYEQMNEALNENGIICAQGECFWTNQDLIVNVVACCADVFDTVEYASASVPTYPCGQIGFILAGKGRTDTNRGENGSVNVLDYSLRRPSRELSEELQSQLKWYNTDIHRASFVLPQFLEEKLAPLRPQSLEEEDEEEEEDEGEDVVNCLKCSIM